MKRAGMVMVALFLVVGALGCNENPADNRKIVGDRTVQEDSTDVTDSAGVSDSIGVSDSTDVSDSVEVGEPGPVTDVQKRLIISGNEFTWRLFREVVQLEAANPNKNIVISPLSASLALGMTYNGARGTTQTAMESTLGFDGLSSDEINQAYRALIDRFAAVDPKVKFQIANAIWHTDHFAVEPEFIDLNRTYFDAVVTALDFDSPSALVTINNWASENTNGKIPTILDEIPGDVVMYLMNALYFKGTWTYRFDPDDTQPRAFNCADGSLHQCDFMSMEADSLRMLVEYGETGVTAVELPYGDGDYRFLAVQPLDTEIPIDRIIANLDGTTWSRWLAGLRHWGEPIALPKFKLQYEINLNEVLSVLGMGVAFTDFADFRGINAEVHLAISEVKQKTFVQLDEEGTEAAAVTSVGIYPTSVGPSFVFNQPFLVVIFERNSGAVLFVGKIAKPEFQS